MIPDEPSANRPDRQCRCHCPCDAETSDAGCKAPSEIRVRRQVERGGGADCNRGHICKAKPAVHAYRATADSEPQLDRTREKRHAARRDVRQEPRAARFVAGKNRRIEQEIRKRDADEEPERQQRGESDRRKTPPASSGRDGCRTEARGAFMEWPPSRGRATGTIAARQSSPMPEARQEVLRKIRIVLGCCALSTGARNPERHAGGLPPLGVSSSLANRTARHRVSSAVTGTSGCARPTQVFRRLRPGTDSGTLK